MAGYEGDRVQMWQQTIKNLTGKGGEQPVFSRTLSSTLSNFGL
jgi:hypothetical protein